MDPKTLNFVFINGKGGSGKDTQAEQILTQLGDRGKRISTGEIYRDARDNSGEYARYHDLVAPFIPHVEGGGYLPDEVVVLIVKEQVLELAKGGKDTFLFTGFPRTDNQLYKVDQMLNELQTTYQVRSRHIYYELPDEISHERAGFRRKEHEASGAQVRKDDHPEVVANRLKTFEEKTKPMITRLAKEGRLIVIDASGTITEIQKETSIRLHKER